MSTPAPGQFRPNLGLRPNMPGFSVPRPGGLLSPQMGARATAMTPTPSAPPPASDPTNTGPMGTGPAFNMGRDMYRTGRGLLNGGVAGNGFGQVELNPTTLRNPAINGMIGDIRNTTNQFLDARELSNQGQAVASGGLGGSRQGVADGVARAQAADFLSGNISNLLGGMYENQANRNMQQYGIDNQMYTSQRGQDLASVGLGANLINQGLETQWSPINNTADIYSKFSGLGSSSSTNSQGGGWMGALGGGLGGLQFMNNLLGGNNRSGGGWW